MAQEQERIREGKVWSGGGGKGGLGGGRGEGAKMMETNGRSAHYKIKYFWEMNFRKVKRAYIVL